MIKPNIKNMIEKDIERCKDSFKDRNGSESLYLELRTRYSTIDKNFPDNIKETHKSAVVGGMEFDFRPELRQIKAKLEMYIQLDEIPIVYNENTAGGVNIEITAKKFKNKGNLGVNNTQSKQKTINENGEKKTSWFKNWSWFGRKK